jgi:hypothetical protein
MKFRTTAPTVLIASIAIVIVAISFISIQISHRMAAASEEEQFALMAEIIKSKISGAENKALASAETIGAIPSVKKAFAERDREALLAATKAAYEIQHQKYAVNLGQFHLPDFSSFLRLHSPARFGDDLSSYRQIVVEVNRVKGIRKGIEITQSNIGIFGTIPMTDEAGQHDGSFEISLEFGSIFEELKKAYGFEVSVFIDEQMLHDTATLLKGDVFNVQNRVGKYIKYYSTHADLSRSLVSDNEINITEDTHYLREVGGVQYGVLLQPVYNYAHKQIGVYAIAKDFSATRSASGQAIIWQGLLGLISIVLLTGVVLIVIRGLLLQPLSILNKRVAALVAGGHGQNIENADLICEEMQQLTQNCALLQAQTQSPDLTKGDAS